MGFYLYTGNRLEILLKQKLCSILSQQPLSDPFKHEKIIVQSQGMSSWLKQQVADNLPICANIDFPFLYSFIKEVLEKTLPQNFRPDIDLFTHDVLTWKIFNILPEISKKYHELSTYLRGKSSNLKQYQLSEKISYSLDQYEIFRPDILLNWNNKIIKNKSNEWQAEIWKNISDKKISRSQGFHNFFSYADLSKLDYERIFVFGITAMPTVYLSFFQALGSSKNIDIHFFYLNPCMENWEYNLSKRETEKVNDFLNLKKIANRDDFIEKGNPLLSSFGQVGREFFSTILDITEYDTEDCYIASKNITTLEQIQNNILNNKHLEDIQFSEKNDRSIQFHNCHNKTRELEVLFDNLLNMIDHDSSIEPGDIIVTIPDISDYESYIKSVFSRRNSELPDNQMLPFSLSDIKVTKNSKVLNSFIKLLELANSKYKMSDILDLLETSAIREAFSIEDESIDLIRKWIEDSGMRWGIDSKHRIELGLPPFDENSIKTGLNRLILGLSIEDSDIYQNILPYDEIEISESELLGKFSCFLSSLTSIHSLLSKKHSPNHWHDILNDIIDQFFISSNDTFKDISILTNAIESFKSSTDLAEFEEEIPLDIVKSFLTEHLEAETVYEGFLRGKITFCTMLPMRGIPAKVICMLGMNDGEFPRQETKLGFNIISKEIRLCDRSRKLEDKYIFLESILAARNILYMSYIGQSDRSNEIYPPAAPVCELIDYLKQSYGEEAVRSFITNHTLQAFNRKYFDCFSDNFFSYSMTECNAAKSLLSPNKPNTQFFLDFNINQKDQLNINLEELVSFFKNPSKNFLQHTINAAYPSIGTEESFDTEPFSINNLDRYNLTNELLDAVIQNKDKDIFYQRLRCSGKLQVGTEGKNYYNNLFTQIDTMLSNSYKGTIPLKDLLNSTDNTNFEIELSNNVCIKGNLEHVSKLGYQVYLRLAKESGKRMLECLLQHLCLTAAEQGKETYYFICKPGEKTHTVGTLENMTRQNALHYLETLTNIYREGLNRPVPFFPEASYTLATTRKQKLQNARSKFTGSNYSSFNAEIKDQYIRRCFSEDIIDSDSFLHYTKQVFHHCWVDEE